MKNRSIRNTSPSVAVRRQRGWTLPITWILLLAALVLMYFFGWTVLLVVLGLGLAISLGVFLYDRFVSPGRNGRTVHFQIESDRELQELGRLIENVFQTTSFEHDHENVWEWCEAESTDGMLRFNMSRKHRRGSPEYLRVRFDVTYVGPRASLEVQGNLGRKLAEILETDVRAGSIEYLGGNEFRFTEEAIFNYPA